MAKRAPANPPKSFEEAIEELEKILADIENGELGLEDSLAKYERGNHLLHYCRGVLGAAEKKIELLSRGPGGEIARAPLEDDLPAAAAADRDADGE
jgi:exodeoxyribonuclease VII small subunit